MTGVPLLTTATFKAAENIANLAPQPIRPYASRALHWLRHKFDPLPEDEDPDNERQPGDDDVSREHEEEELRRPVEMSRMSVPFLHLEESSKRTSKSTVSFEHVEHIETQNDWTVLKKPGYLRERRVYSTPPESPIKTPISTPNLEPERMLISATPSPVNTSTQSTTPFTITGSAFIIPIKTRISPRSQAAVEAQLNEAMNCEFFKMWPTLEDPRPHGAARKDAEESGVYERELGDGEKERKEALLKAWKQKGERNGASGNAGRRVVRGRKGWSEGEGWESVVEGVTLKGLEGFRPTLMGVEGLRPRSRERSWDDPEMVGPVKNRESREEQDRARKSGREGGRKYKEVLAGRERQKRPSAPAPLANVQEVVSWEEKRENHGRPPRSSRDVRDQEKDAISTKQRHERSSGRSKSEMKPGEAREGKENDTERRRSNSKNRKDPKPGTSEASRARTNARTRSMDRKRHESSDSEAFDSRPPE